MVCHRLALSSCTSPGFCLSPDCLLLDSRSWHLVTLSLPCTASACFLILWLCGSVGMWCVLAEELFGCCLLVVTRSKMETLYPFDSISWLVENEDGLTWSLSNALLWFMCVCVWPCLSSLGIQFLPSPFLHFSLVSCFLCCTLHLCCTVYSGRSLYGHLPRNLLSCFVAIQTGRGKCAN